MDIIPFHDSETGTFTYLVDDCEGQCAVVDPVMKFDPRTGTLDPAPAEAVAAVIERRRLTLRWLLETHAHADHLSAAAWLKERLGGDIAIGAEITAVQRHFADLFDAPDMSDEGGRFDRLLTAGERLTLGPLSIEVLAVPGHTPADVAYRFSDSASEGDAVFVGDTLLMPHQGTARCDFPGGDAARLFRSVRRLLELPAETRLYVCHDYVQAGLAARCTATVAEHRRANVHVRDGISEPDFVQVRQARDAALAVPALMLAALQVNLRAGCLPAPKKNGTSYLKLPVSWVVGGDGPATR